jgi:hypothetical protein
MPRSVLLLLALGAAAPIAGAQDIWDDPGGVETDWDFEAGVVAAPFSDESVLYVLRGGAQVNYVLDNGMELGARAGLELLADHPSRPDFSGIFPPSGPAGTQPPGAFSRLARGQEGDVSSPRLNLDAAYVYADGGYGELRLGADDGVATRFFEGGPALFAHAGLVNPALDPTGRLIARTEPDLTGMYPKISYASPRILGLRLGASFTPEAELEGFQTDLANALEGGAAPELSDALEIALNVSRRLPPSGVRLRGALGWSRADVAYSLQPGLYDTVETWSAGGSAEFGSVTLGGSWLSSNNGVAAGNGDYTAWSAGISRTLGTIDLIAEYTGAEDDFAALESNGWQAGLAWRPEPGWRVAAGWRDETLTTRPLGPLAAANIREGRSGIVLEITHSR